jgi:hypothetical protein
MQRSKAVCISYDAADFGEEFDFEFLETDSPGDVSVELILVNEDGKSSEGPCSLGAFQIPGVELSAAARHRSSFGQQSKEISFLDPSIKTKIVGGELADKKNPIMLFNLRIVEDIRRSESSFVLLFHIDSVVSFKEEYLTDRGLIINVNFLKQFGIAKEEYRLSDLLFCSKGEELHIFRHEDSRFFAGEFNGWQVTIPTTLIDVQRQECTVCLSISSKAEYFDTLSLFQKLSPNASIQIDPSNELLCPFLRVKNPIHGNVSGKSSFQNSRKYAKCCSQFGALDRCVSQQLQDLESATSRKEKINFEWDLEKEEMCTMNCKNRKPPKGASCRAVAVEIKNKQHTSNQSNSIKSATASSSFSGQQFPVLADGEGVCCFYCATVNALKLGFKYLTNGDSFEAKRHVNYAFSLLQQDSAENSKIYRGYELLDSKLKEIKLLSLNSRMFESAQTGNLQILRKCLEQGADLTASLGEIQWTEGKGLFKTQPFLQGFTVIHFAVMPCMGSEKQSKLRCLEYVCALAGCPTKSISADGRHAVHVAVREIHCLRFLVEKLNQNPDAKDISGRTALHHAALYGRSYTNNSIY